MSTAITSFIKYVAADVMPCPTPIIERVMLSTIIEFCDKTHILQREFNIELDTDSIDSDMQDSIDVSLSEFVTSCKPITVLEFNLDGSPKFAKFRELVNTIPSSVWNNIKEEETIYFSFPSNTVIRLYDRSTSDSNLFVRLAVKPTRAATEVDDLLMEDWVDTISEGVKSKILIMPGKEWTDPKGAAASYMEYRRGISRARMKMLKSYTSQPLEVSPRAYGQIDWD